ncbi:hypothetical protein M426DRAFT_121471 [Hypoxylon sp. CI-4A]|nr:hypothetical protein M426DRAFT_121471 [Hypoxylon sp. CI-4A]
MRELRPAGFTRCLGTLLTVTWTRRVFLVRLNSLEPPSLLSEALPPCSPRNQWNSLSKCKGKGAAYGRRPMRQCTQLSYVWPRSSKLIASRFDVYIELMG